MSQQKLKIVGEMVVIALKARNLPNREIVGKQDPFCVFRIGDNSKKTKTDYRGGQHPIWDDQVNIPVPEGKNTMFVQVFDEDPRKEDLIGECEINLVEIFKEGEADEWYKLQYKGKPAGEVYLELTFYSNAAPPRPAAPQIIRNQQVPHNNSPQRPPRPPPQQQQQQIPGGYPQSRPSPSQHYNPNSPTHYNTNSPTQNIYPPQQAPAPIPGGYPPVAQHSLGYPPRTSSAPPVPPPQLYPARPNAQHGVMQTPRPPPQVPTYQPALATTPIPAANMYRPNLPLRTSSPAQNTNSMPLLSSAYIPNPTSPPIPSQPAAGYPYPSSYAPSNVGGFVIPQQIPQQQPPFAEFPPAQQAPFIPPHTSPAPQTRVGTADPYAGQYPPPAPIAPGFGQPATYDSQQPPHYI